jgi:hypothetical protein
MFVKRAAAPAVVAPLPLSRCIDKHGMPPVFVYFV